MTALKNALKLIGTVATATVVTLVPNVVATTATEKVTKKLGFSRSTRDSIKMVVSFAVATFTSNINPFKWMKRMYNWCMN